jgi:hypothetical protein
MPKVKELTKQRDALLATLKGRFAEHPHRHEGIEWPVEKEVGRARRLPSLCEARRRVRERPSVTSQSERDAELWIEPEGLTLPFRASRRESNRLR